jgi:hypothetical protein
VGARENSEIYYSVTGVFPFTPLRSEWCRSEECPLKLLKCCSNLYQCSVPHMRLPLRRRVGCGSPSSGKTMGRGLRRVVAVNGGRLLGGAVAVWALWARTECRIVGDAEVN